MKKAQDTGHTMQAEEATHTQMTIESGEENPNNLKSSEIETLTEKVEGTPFIKRWDKKTGWSFGIGNYRISEFRETEEEIIELINSKEWSEIHALVGAVIDATLRMHNLIK